MMREPSVLPECEGTKRSFIPRELVHQLVAVVSVFVFLDFATYWLAGRLPNLSFYLIIMCTFASAFRWGACAGAATLTILTLATQWFWGDGFDWFMTLVGGTSMMFLGTIWKSLWHELVEKRGGGEGRLAWQGSEVGAHPMLWHNGMVGGSASFLGIVPEFELGVVVLTNTAKTVDAIGITILSELVELKEKELRKHDSDS